MHLHQTLGTRAGVAVGAVRVRSKLDAATDRLFGALGPVCNRGRVHDHVTARERDGQGGLGLHDHRSGGEGDGARGGVHRARDSLAVQLREG